MADPRASFLEKLVEPTVQFLGFELWGVEQTGTGRHKRVCIYIDTPAGVSVADCEKVATQLNVLLAVEDATAGTYELEVSSPGMDRLLFKKAHFQSSVGEQVDVRLHLPMDGTRRYQGLLQQCQADAITLVVEDDVKVVPLTQVRRARLVPRFD